MLNWIYFTNPLIAILSILSDKFYSYQTHFKKHFIHIFTELFKWRRQTLMKKRITEIKGRLLKSGYHISIVNDAMQLWPNPSLSLNGKPHFVHTSDPNNPRIGIANIKANLNIIVTQKYTAINCFPFVVKFIIQVTIIITRKFFYAKCCQLIRHSFVLLGERLKPNFTIFLSGSSVLDSQQALFGNIRPNEIAFARYSAVSCESCE